MIKASPACGLPLCPAAAPGSSGRYPLTETGPCTALGDAPSGSPFHRRRQQRQRLERQERQRQERQRQLSGSASPLKDASERLRGNRRRICLQLRHRDLPCFRSHSPDLLSEPPVWPGKERCALCDLTALCAFFFFFSSAEDDTLLPAFWELENAPGKTKRRLFNGGESPTKL